MIQTDIGSFVQPEIGLVPQSAVPGNIPGPAINREGFLSAVLVGTAGADVGATTARSFNVKIQESVDGNAPWVDVPDGAILPISTVDSQNDVNVDLRGVKKFIRAFGAAAITGGTNLFVGATVILGGSRTKPV